MKTYIELEIIKEKFNGGFFILTDKMLDIINDNKIERGDDEYISNDYIQIEKINLVFQNNNLVLNPNTRYLKINMKENIVDFSCSCRRFNCTHINIAIPSMRLNILKMYGYFDYNKLYIIATNELPSKYKTEENNLFTIDKIKNTFLPYVDLETQDLYKKIVFPVMADINLNADIKHSEPKFTILNIEKEKGINGYTYIEAKCIQDNQLISIKIPHLEVNKNLIQEKLIKEYNNIIKCNEDMINVGDII